MIYIKVKRNNILSFPDYYCSDSMMQLNISSSSKELLRFWQSVSRIILPIPKSEAIFKAFIVAITSAWKGP